jgi:hypothetical protein
LTLIAKDIEKPVEEIPDGNRKRQDRKPMLFEERNPFIAMRQAFVLDELSKENIAPNGAQSEGDWIKNEPEDDLFRFYLGPVFLFGECDDNFNISEFLGIQSLIILEGGPTLVAKSPPARPGERGEILHSCLHLSSSTRSIFLE